MKEDEYKFRPRKKNFLNRLMEFIEESNIKYLFYTPIFVALAILFISIAIEVIFGYKVPKSTTRIIISIAMIISSLSGFVLIIKEEMPSPFENIYQNNLATLMGVIVIVIYWMIAIAVIFI